jgi:hypothetical protein
MRWRWLLLPGVGVLGSLGLLLLLGPSFPASRRGGRTPLTSGGQDHSKARPKDELGVEEMAQMDLIRRLDSLSVEQRSLGGPYGWVVSNDTTEAIVQKGDVIIPLLIDNLNHDGVNGTIFTVHCLHELKAKSAKVPIRDLERSLMRGERFKNVRRDPTLEVQIQFFLRDVDSW